MLHFCQWNSKANSQVFPTCTPQTVIIAFSTVKKEMLNHFDNTKCSILIISSSFLSMLLCSSVICFYKGKSNAMHKTLMLFNLSCNVRSAPLGVYDYDKYFIYFMQRETATKPLKQEDYNGIKPIHFQTDTRIIAFQTLYN